MQICFLKLNWLLIQCHLNADRIKKGHDLVEVLQGDFLCCWCGQTSCIFIILIRIIEDIYTYCTELLVLQLSDHISTIANISFPLWVSALILWHFWGCGQIVGVWTYFMIILYNIIHPSSYLMPFWSLPVLICLLSVTAKNCTVDCLLYTGKLYRIALLRLTCIN